MKFNFNIKPLTARAKKKLLFVVIDRPDIVVISLIIIIFLFLGSIFLKTISPALNFEPGEISSGVGIDYSLYETARDNLARHELQAAEALERVYLDPFNRSAGSNLDLSE